MKFRPALVPTVLVAIGLVILVNLGLWQLRRNAAKEAIEAQLSARQATERVTNADLNQPPDELLWRLAEIRGRYVGEPFLITGRFEFSEVGYDVVQALQVDGGPVILVNRGWIPREGHQRTVEELQTDETVTVRGLIYEPQVIGGAFASCGPDRSKPVLSDGQERWLPESYPAIAERVPGALPVVLIAGEPLEPGQTKEQKVPATGFRVRQKAVPHLEYAATWFGIAGTLLLIWIVAGFRRGAQQV